MNKKVRLIPADKIQVREKGGKAKLRAAVYCRVSTDEERQLESFENQVEHYTRFIAASSKYELVKVYSDEGISGCRTRSRKGFLNMIDDCEAGKIDMIITKSISRFARNTQDSLNYTRKLKDMNIGIFFEKEGINTLESSGELLLTLFSCFAQEESRSISENTAWGIRSRFQQGIPHINVKTLLGYDKDGEGRLIINEEQAATVRRIFRMYLEGFSLGAIAGTLNRENIPGVHGEAKWCAVTIDRMLGNEKYKGDLLMQKTFTANYLTKHQIRNTGQVDQYYIENDHPPIIPPEEWEAVQEEKARRKEFCAKYGLRGLCRPGASPFYGRLFCEKCGSVHYRIYRRGVKKPFWQCRGCEVKIDEEALREKFCGAFNSLVRERASFMEKWERSVREDTPLGKIRAAQMIEITAGGPIEYEVPELTRAILQEGWHNGDGDVRFIFLSGECV